MSNELTITSEKLLTKSFIKSVETRPRLGGKQLIIRCKNNYGVSIVQFPGSYGYAEGLYELAPLKFTGNGEAYEICYESSFENDVLGYLTPQEVLDVLEKISRLA